MNTDIPKRKPVPLPVIKDKDPPPDSANGQKENWFQLPQRKRTIIVIAVFGSLALIALIVGLAVGLTTKGKGSSNLPLPTSYGGPYKGDLTYYDPALGSCGITSTSSDLICAVSHKLFDAASTGSNPNANPLCGMKVRVKLAGNSVDVKIVDRCVGCDATDLDVSPAAFKRLADLDLGRVLVDWAWLDDSPVKNV
ncbi:hypothetical protein EYZ11_009293 [Aspergillus tanneri]|uniref:RlpA-like protein double-psi beta-barrel domain-containing protein n=1 Tax=Aspergillus tanneri TaxID=1220188 RepID=A0A4V3UNH9_9EURO|nr:hypothetical protein EYZ11_009293 [Aspergillus tanneri]